MRLDQRYPGRFDPPPPSRGPPNQPPTGWRRVLFLALGLIAAVLLTLALVNSVAGLATAPKPLPEAGFDIPAYATLLNCNAHVGDEILRLKNGEAAVNTRAALSRLHRDYRRLHRLLRQVGRRDGIPPTAQTKDLRTTVNALHDAPATKSAAHERDQRCQALAQSRIARKRISQTIVGR